MQIKVGDLIYAPAEVVLCVMDDESKMVLEYCRLPKPENLLVLDHDSKSLKVLYDSKVWWVKKKEVHNVG